MLLYVILAPNGRMIGIHHGPAIFHIETDELSEAMITQTLEQAHRLKADNKEWRIGVLECRLVGALVPVGKEAGVGPMQMVG